MVEQVGVQNEDTKLDWDAGLNQGLVYRPKAQKSPPDDDKTKKGWYPGPAKPAYYAESNPLIPYAKAIGLAFVAVVPYFTILDQLGHNTEFVPCNDVSCHYMRLFNSKNIPATGATVVSVRNGVERPLALHYEDFDAYSCPLLQGKRPFSEKIWGDMAAACPQLSKHNYTAFIDVARDVKPLMKKETDFANDFTFTLKIAFWITKGPLWLFSYPMNLIAKTNPSWGMEHVPSATCPGKTYEEMQQQCIEINEENKKDPKKGLIANHLRTWGPAKIGVVLGLVGYAVFTAVHDVLLLANQPEMWSITMGFLATTFYGIAGVSMFFWAMGAAEVFVAPGKGHDMSECACFYQIPEITALIGLSTPFAVFAGFMARVQMQGLAALFGDFLAYQTYYIPHYLGKQSFLWTWAVLCSPKMAGTIQGDKREVKESDWDWWRLQQLILWYLSMFLQFIVALSASSFMIAFKELCTSLYLKDTMTPMVQAVIKYVILPAPSAVTVVVGAIASYDLACMTVPQLMDAGETFTGQLKTILPCIPRTKGPFDKFLGYTTFFIGEVLLLSWTIAVAQGLCPDRDFLLGKEELTHPKLAQAELWGACGFIFFFAHIPRIMAIAFSTWEDLESLKWLSQKMTNQVTPAGDPKYGLLESGK